MGLEATARALRYRFLEQTAKEQGAARIATAHTADDNLETFLLHLTRAQAFPDCAEFRPDAAKLSGRF
jgi:tRNA(Ile)-lysidine synthase TilS/MesJ